MQEYEENGLLPPQAIESEEYVIAAILLEGNLAFTEAAIRIESHKEFYKEKHRLIYKAFESLVSEKKVIDMTMTIQKLRAQETLDEIGGSMAIAELTNKIGSAANIIGHAAKVKEYYIKRELIKINHEYINKLYSGDYDVSDLKDEMSGLQAELFRSLNSALSAKQAISSTLKMVENIKEGTAGTIRLTHTPLDKVFMFSRDELIWLGAMKKAGKTKVTITLMVNLLRHNDDIAIRWFSMENPIEEVWAHFGAIETGIDVTKIIGKNKDGKKLTNDEYKRFKLALKKYENADIDITYGRYNINKLTSESLQFVHKRKNKFNIIIIDNFNILINSAKGSGQTEKESYIADKIQDLRTEANRNGMNTVVYVVDHLKKTGDQRDALKLGFRPTDEDLKGSGRKGEVLTQLVSMNKPSNSQLLMSEEKAKGEIIINNKSINRVEIVKRLIIFESLTSRYNSTNSVMLKMLSNLGTMRWMDYKEFIEKGKINDELNDDVQEVEAVVETVKPQIKKNNLEIDPFDVKIEEKQESNTQSVSTSISELKEVILSEEGDDLPF